MARVIAGVATSHVPAIGAAIDHGRTREPYWKPLFDGVEPAHVVAKLRESYIFGRTIVLTQPQGIRLSIGVWNRESDIERIAEAVNSIAKDSGG